MPLATKTLAELAKLNAGIGPSDSAQLVASDTDLSSPVLNADFGSLLAGALVDGDGVDLSEATLCVVRVIPTGGNVVFDVVARTEGKVSEFETLNGLEGVDTSKPWKEIVFVGPEAELVVLPTAGTATSVEITVAPCLGV